MSFDGFINIQGIKGDSTDSAHAEWIEIQAFSHQVVQSTGGAASAQGTHAGGRADHGDFSIVKRLDSGSAALFMHCCSAKPIPEIVIELCRAMGEKTVFMKYTLKDSIVSAVKPSGSTDGDDLIPLEEVSFRYGEVHLEYTPTDPRSGGKTGAAIMGAWSTMENTPL
ncbi:MAG: type VI secretion system tube protein Hcp [Phycisphaerales bacterium]|nr:type VI secretion system tube protein Hcp [Phycisphaerales bacterium]